MKLTKNQKRYASILGVCVFALALDQLFLSSPSPASAGPSNPPSDAPPRDATSISDTLSLPRDTARPQTSLAVRFENIRNERSLDPMNVRDAFRAPAHWLPDETGYDDEPVVDNSAATRAAERFIDNHRLNAVMANSAGGYALVDGQRLRVGQALDGFVLIEVRARSVVLEKDDVQVELLLAETKGTNDKP